MRRSRMSEIFVQEGLKWRHEETWFGERVDPDLARKRGRSSSSTRQRRPAASSSASTRWAPSQQGPPGPAACEAGRPEAERARQEIDYGRRGVAGYVFGALQPATGEALTLTYERRTTVNWVDFLGAVEAWIDPAVERVYAVLDNLNIHSAPDVLLFRSAPSALGVRLPARLRGLPEPDRALVEDFALSGLEGAPLRGLGRDRAGSRTGHRLLERAQAPVPLGPAATPPPTPSLRDCRRPETHTHLADEPVRDLAGDRYASGRSRPAWRG
jgi:hypothetical protein